MKNLLFLLSLFLFAQELLAQKKSMSFGLKGGISVGEIRISPLLQNRTTNFGAGLVAGGFTLIPVTKKIRLQVESLYNLHRSSVSFSNTDYSDPKKIDLSLHQISLPIQLGYYLWPKLWLNAGISANYNFYFQQKVTFDNSASPDTYATFNITEEIVKFQPGALGSITYYPAKNILVEGRYQRMLTNSYTRPGDDFTRYAHSFFQVFLGYQF